MAPRSSISLDAFETFPILFFRRMTLSAFLSPSSVKRGTRKQESPGPVCARTRNASHIGAERNHLWPSST